MLSTRKVTDIARSMGIEYARTFRTEGPRVQRVKIYDVAPEKAEALAAEMRATLTEAKEVAVLTAPFGEVKSVAVYF
jgi:ornithine cyclodeaminase/alanine dehydrogenase-like protein (mu-crystallin family)